jgi:hypothetical protein
VLKPTWPTWRVRPFTPLRWWNGTSGKNQKTDNKDCAADGSEDHGYDPSPTSPGMATGDLSRGMKWFLTAHVWRYHQQPRNTTTQLVGFLAWRVSLV